MGFGDFLSSLTPERERALLDDYNAWRESKGLKPVEALAPAPAPVRREADPAEAPRAAGRPSDDISAMMESIADEIEEEEIEENAALSKTMQEIDAIEVEEGPAPEEEEALAEDFDDEDEDEDEPAPDADDPEEAPAPAAAEDSADTPVAVLLSRLPKEPDVQRYEALLSRFESLEHAVAAAEETLRDHTRRHRGTAALRAFLKWLEDARG